MKRRNIRRVGKNVLHALRVIQDPGWRYYIGFRGYVYHRAIIVISDDLPATAPP